MTPDHLIVPALTLTNAAVNLEHQVKQAQGRPLRPEQVERLRAEAAVVRRQLDAVDAELVKMGEQK